MQRYGLTLLASIVVVGCSPKYESGKTECSTGKLCPSGFSCKDDGTSGTHYCFENEVLGCPSDSGFYCAQSKTCWPKPVVCGPNGPLPDASSGAGGRDGGAGGVRGTGGATGFGGYYLSGGATGRGGSGGLLGTGGLIGTGGHYLSGGVTGRGGSGGLTGSGGYYVSGGVTGRGGTTGSGGTTIVSVYCSGTPYPCSYQEYEGDCLTENGCVWNPSTYMCTGAASACSTYTTSTWCLYNGCDWAGPMSCKSTPATSYCLDEITSDSTYCDICIYSSCCGQTTDCMNDYDCYYNSKGPSWNAWVDCAINCCGSVCEWY